ncbi:M48 family metallopeptidase [bacterium]|nr:M48 family metallopeptidase [bacterium]
MNQTATIKYGSERIKFQIIYSERKTLEISVHPDSNVVVRAPKNTDFREIEERVIKRSRWIQKKRLYFRQFEPRTPVKKFVAGESHLYLGKRYRLKITCDETNSVKLVQGFFHITINGTIMPEMVKILLDKWYYGKSIIKLNEFYENCWASFKKYSNTKPVLKIQEMKTRWGSLSQRRMLTLNRRLIKAPKECIDYVIFHELCHLIHKNHSPEFYNLLEKVMPDWEKRKHRLEMALV